MAHNYLLLAFFFLSSIPSLYVAFPIKAVNLGNWLVVEGWMEPSLFRGIPEADLLDGTKVQFMSTKSKKFLTAEQGGGTKIVANRAKADAWETFILYRISKTRFNLRVSNKNFMGLEGNAIVAASDKAGAPETFQIVRSKNNTDYVRLKASNNQFLQARSETVETADNPGTTWDHSSDPSIFKMNITGRLEGEYQLTNGYGQRKTRQILRKHWDTYITEDDFNFLSTNGLNAVRVPVGWWIAKVRPPKPFIGGSLQYLDKAFKWARYADHPSLLGIELMNEPTARCNGGAGIKLKTLKKYYRRGYKAVRKYSKDAYVIFSQRLGDCVQPAELLSFARNFYRVIIDFHFYNYFTENFRSMTPEQNIDYINKHRFEELRNLTNNGAHIFVGEWFGQWYAANASKEQYQEFTKAQQKVFGRKTFGWAYWSYKISDDKFKHASLRWMIENNYMNII